MGPTSIRVSYHCLDGQFDYFHELIITQELVRTGARGYGDGLLAGSVIGLPPVLNFGSEGLKAKVVPDVLAGKKFISLAVSEPFAGSDVGGLRTTATLSEDKKHWIVNGTKKCVAVQAIAFVALLLMRLNFSPGGSQMAILVITSPLDVEQMGDSLSFSSSARRE